MRQEHRAGEKLFIDFSGDGIDVIDPKTGEVTTAVLFVAALGASSYTYVEPVLRQDLPTWTKCHENAAGFFQGVTELWIPDNLRAGVTKADRYEPELNPTYRDLAEHYQVAIIPARVRKPKDKAKVKLTPEQIAMARERAEKAGRRYPNLVDNMWAAKLAAQEKDLP
jgi:transposase